MNAWGKLAVSLALVAAAGCASSGGDGDAEVSDTLATAGGAETDPSPTAAATSTSEPALPAETGPVVTEPPTTAASVDVPAAWGQIVPDSPDCACSDGSEFSFFDRPGDPTKVMFYFQGGGACFNLATCDPATSSSYTKTVEETPQSLTISSGLFDTANPENPLAEHSVVYVPYCTGDVHLGNTTTDYGEGVVIEHRGAANAQAALDYLIGAYPDAEQIFVTGASAGSVPTPIVAGLVSDAYPEAEVITFGDSSGAYPDVPAVNATIGSLWGTTNAIPDWPENVGLTAEEWSFPGLYIQAGLHAPNITFARFDYAFDQVQATFSALAGIGSDAVVEGIDATEAQVEAGGSDLATYVAPGTEHTIMGRDAVYEMEVEGVRLIDWIAELVNGDVPADVHCVDCQT